MKLLGEIRTGKNDFSFWMEKLLPYYIQKTGMIFFPGTLNVHLIECKYYFPLDCIRLEKEEYGGTVSISMTPCTILAKNAYILRTDSDRKKHGYSPEQILEIATNVKLRDGDVIEVEVNKGKMLKI
ncbi:MAG: hypothetical protein RLZZ171_2510 [Cyanobacteriota bacterium]|jgi:riboflavin kinase